MLNQTSYFIAITLTTCQGLLSPAELHQVAPSVMRNMEYRARDTEDIEEGFDTEDDAVHDTEDWSCSDSGVEDDKCDHCEARVRC